MTENIQIDSVPTNGIDIGPILFLERYGAKIFSIPNVNGFFQYNIAIDRDNEKKYILTYVNGQRMDDFFVQAPVLKKIDGKMMFMNYAVEKDSVGWRVVN